MQSKNYPNSEALQAIIFERIAASGEQRITFAEYMDLVLYHPEYGYYSSGIVEIGAAGDYFTSVSLGKDFGELLAIQFVEMWKLLGKPVPFTLVEMGAGNGRGAIDILNYLESHHPDLIEVLEYVVIEEAKELIHLQQKNCQEYLSDTINISWKSWPEVLDDSVVGCFFSNELIDAFPVHQIRINQNKIEEVFLTQTGNQLQEIYGEISSSKILNYFELVTINLSNNNYPNNYRTEVNLAVLNWIEKVATKLHKGYLLTIDYGYPATKYYHPQRRQGTLQCYYQHRRHNNPYINLGYQDITSHVDFTALEKQGELWRLEKIDFTQQGMFLMALGLGDRLNELSSGKFDFRELMQRRDALHQLIAPVGLGGFGVLIQGKALQTNQKILKGLTIPPMF
jgi:SAM-dependent MidA family methyltransferase